MDETDTTTQLDQAFAILSNAKRRGMIYTLAFRPSTVSQLANEHGLSLPAVHKHIRALEEAGLIHRRKIGRTNFVTLNAPTLALPQQWLNQYQTTWATDEQTLENYHAGLTD